MQTQSFIRKPFEPVQAIQVTVGNEKEIAEWCGGVVQYDDVDHSIFFIKVPVKHPLNQRQTQAYAGDWVLSSSNGFKTYTDEAFHRNFDPKFEGEDSEHPASGKERGVQSNVFDQTSDLNDGPPEELMVVKPADAVSGQRHSRIIGFDITRPPGGHRIN